eukprot:2108725-Rhodomonas_salina.1
MVEARQKGLAGQSREGWERALHRPASLGRGQSGGGGGGGGGGRKGGGAKVTRTPSGRNDRERRR